MTSECHQRPLEFEEEFAPELPFADLEKPKTAGPLSAREIAAFLRVLKNDPEYQVSSNHRRHFNRLVKALHEGRFR